MPDSTGKEYFDPTLAMWPDLAGGKKQLMPVGVGMDRKTGKMIMGWDHVQQSMTIIFATPFHERVMRRWCGSFVPHILGESAIARVITRFYWAMASAIDLWEPRYRIKRVLFMARALATENSPPPEASSAEMLRKGNGIFKHEGVYRPRGHLGDSTPETSRSVGLISRGNHLWDIAP